MVLDVDACARFDALLPHALTHQQSQDFTFGLTVDDEEDGIVGKIMVEANAEGNIDDGDLLCILLHRGEADEASNEGDDSESSRKPSD